MGNKEAEDIRDKFLNKEISSEEALWLVLKIIGVNNPNEKITAKELLLRIYNKYIKNK